MPKRERKRNRGADRAAVRQADTAALRDQIRRLLEKPMAERTHFLRVRLRGGGSAL